MKPSQLSFEALLADANSANVARQLNKEYGHLPATMEAAIPFFRDLINRHHEAMMAGNADKVRGLREEAGKLACKLNNYEPGIIADEQAPGSVLARVTAAKPDTVPLWGQVGSFEIGHSKVRIRIEMEGLYGIGATYRSWLGFSAHAVDKKKPFLSETGYRSFLGVGGALEAGYAPDVFVKAIIAAYVDQTLKGRLRKIVPIKGRARRQA
jgi:hypothetical protein